VELPHNGSELHLCVARRSQTILFARFARAGWSGVVVARNPARRVTLIAPDAGQMLVQGLKSGTLVLELGPLHRRFPRTRPAVNSAAIMARSSQIRISWSSAGAIISIS
jgi:hypothetical protein